MTCCLYRKLPVHPIWLENASIGGRCTSLAKPFMQHVGFAMVGLGFWIFLSVSAVAGIVADYKKRYLQLEPLRIAIERGQQLDPSVIERWAPYNRARRSTHIEAASDQKSVSACATIKGHSRPVRANPYANSSAKGAMPTTPTAPW